MRNSRVAGLVGPVLLMFNGCGDGPTSPMTPTPTSLVGEWHGTMSYSSGDCPSEEVNASASVEDNRVRMDLQSRCYDHVVVVRLGDWGAGPRGHAILQLASCSSYFVPTIRNPTLTATVTGTADQGRLHLESTAFSSGTGFAICTRPGITLDLVR